MLFRSYSDSTPIRVAKQHLFTDNYVLSRARANSAVSYIAGALSVGHENLQVEGRGPSEPVADNSTAAGRQKNRRVELIMSGVRPSRPSFLEVTKAASGAQATATVGAVPGLDRQASGRREIDNSGTPASQQEPLLDSLKPGIAMLLPEKSFAPAIAATKI